MKILWLNNIPLPIISKQLSKPEYNIGGWLTGFANCLLNDKNIELSICFPSEGENLIKGKIGNLLYFGFPYKGKKSTCDLSKYFDEIIEEVHPDLVHIFGTENPFVTQMIGSFNNPKSTIINIQGLVSKIAEHYYSGLPCNVIQRYTIRDLVKMENIKSARNDFYNRGSYEVSAIKSVDNVIGRTEWDKACTKQINPSINYFFCNEILRDTFYKKNWDIKTCERHTLFMSQAMYPIKGLHFMIKALSILVKEYPDTKLYIAGYNIRIGKKKFIDKILRSSYAKYIDKLINKYDLSENISFTGSLNESEMGDRFLRTHVFVSPSSLENESNSLSEAKIIGVPSVASFVGGVTSRITHCYDGFLYQHDAPYMLAHYIKEIFSNDDLALRLSLNARNEALRVHDKTINYAKLMEIYNEVYKKDSKVQL